MTVRVEHHAAGYIALRTHPAMWADIAARAARIAAACNAASSWGGYEWELITQNQGRASANVWTIDDRGIKDNARTNRLLRNLDAGR